MGLDWMLQESKPMNGFASEYARLKQKLEALNDDDKLTEKQHNAIRSDLRAALDRVSINAHEVIEAPRVGIDSEATDWFRKKVFEPMKDRIAAEKQKAEPDAPFVAHWDRPFAQLLKEQTGKWVAELAKKPEGLASITGMMCSALDFRGKAVSMSTVIAEELRNEAFDDHDAYASADYAERLEASLREYQADHPDWRTRTERDEYGSDVDVKDDVEALEAAIRWLRFWGAEGFGFSGWY